MDKRYPPSEFNMGDYFEKYLKVEGNETLSFNS